MTACTGAWALTRLALRLDRIRLPVWVLMIAILPPITAAQYQTLYPSTESISQLTGVINNPAMVAMNGPLTAVSIGGLTVWKVGVTELLLIALMSVLTVIRHSRAEEEAGRLELLGAGVVGRYAPLTAAVAATGLANLVSALLVTLGLAGAGLPVAGSVAFGLTIAVTGLVFAAVAAVTAQLTTSARSAVAIAAAALGGSYLLRAVGDTGPTWLSWLSPIGWAMRVRPYADERWPVLGFAIASIAVLTVVGYALVGRRDLGAGLLAQRRGPAQAANGLRSPFALAWRLHRGLLISWLVAMAACGLTLGGAASGIDAAIGANQQVTQMLARMGGSSGLVDAYLAAVLSITGLVVAAYTVQATLRLRAEEAAGRVEPLLATGVTRTRWALSHVCFALVGSAALLAVAGASAGLAYGAQIHDVGGQTPRLFAGAMAQLPAAWVLAGLGAALFGLAPRLTALTWAGLIACVVLLELGVLLGLPQWLVNASPFAHVPKLPGAVFSATPLAWLTAIAAALTVAGLTGFRRRDIG